MVTVKEKHFRSCTWIIISGNPKDVAMAMSVHTKRGGVVIKNIKEEKNRLVEIEIPKRSKL